MRVKILPLLLACVFLSACAPPLSQTGVTYFYEYSTAELKADKLYCNLLMQNNSEKYLDFSFYGVFGYERVPALNSNGKLLSITLAPNERRSIECCFSEAPYAAPPDKIEIVGVYR